MAFSIVCGACRARLKMPPGAAQKVARCPKCGAAIDLRRVLDATAYVPDSTPPAPGGGRPPPVRTPAEPPLSLDDDTSPTPGANAPTSASPLRVPVRVTADSARQFAGPCEAVLVAHGMFLETVPYHPFLYVPVRSPVLTLTRRTMTVTLPDGRAITIEFTGRQPEQSADETAAFLAGERGVPQPPRRTALPAIVLVLGLVLVAVVGAVAYMATRDPETAQLPAPDPPVKLPAPAIVQPKVEPDPALANIRPRRPPSAVDLAHANGVHRFEDGPDEVTALGVTSGGWTLVVGYKNGTTRVWSLDQPALDPFSLGPKSDGPPTRIQFDETGNIVYLSCTGGTVAAPWQNPPEVPVKIPGEFFTTFPFPGGERFAVVRGNTLVLRLVPTAMIQKPTAGKAKSFVLTTPKDEVQPAKVKGAAAPPPPRPTFLAWHPSGRLLAGQTDGTITAWGPAGAKSMVVSRDHKAPVRAWAASPAAWDFATGDDKGVVGLWLNKAMTPKTFAATPAPITQLSFSPFGQQIAVADAAGNVSVWEVATQKAVAQVKRPTAKAIAFGPLEDLLLISDGKAVELCSIPKLTVKP